MIEFAQRRQALLNQIEADAIVIVVGATQKVRNKNMHFAFRQESHFYYLTGFNEPDAIAVLGAEIGYQLFCHEKDPYYETWFAAQTGLEGAVTHYGANQAMSIKTIDDELPKLLGQAKTLYVIDEQERFNHKWLDWLHQANRHAKFDAIKHYPKLCSAVPIVSKMRMIKSAAEIASIKHAVKASVAGHKALMKAAKPGVSELVLSAEFNRQIAEFGCHATAYPNIIAAGNNACCLHYEAYHSELKSGQLLLVDAGAEYQNYAADITRTIPVNGKFSAEQRDLYQLVLAALDTAIAFAKPALSWPVMYQQAMQVLAQGLLDLKILSGSLEQVMEQQAYLPFTLHKTGHFLGLDVHDVGYYQTEKGWITLEPNMVFTLEPGLYFPTNCQQVDEKWRGMGIRIEDDILVTTNGVEILSKEAPRSITDIENWMND